MPILCGLLLPIDSIFFDERVFDGQWIVNILFPLYFFLMLLFVDRQLRILMIIMVPLSYLGELVCSPTLEMYLYRQHNVPFYIPFGHAVVYGSASVLYRLPIIVRHTRQIKRTLLVFFVIVMAGVGIAFNDTLTIALGLLFFIALQRKDYHIFYLIMGLIVLIIELIGTTLGCWAWQPESLLYFETINPPVGAIFIYVGGDMILWKLTRRVFGFKKQFNYT